MFGWLKKENGVPEVPAEFPPEVSYSSDGAHWHKVPDFRLTSTPAELLVTLPKWARIVKIAKPERSST